MIKKLFHFIFVLLLLALVIGVPGAWMLHQTFTAMYLREATG